MHRDLSRPATAALTTFKAIVLGSLLSLSIGLVPDAAPTTPGRTTPDAVAVDASTSKVDRVMREHDCSTTGFDATDRPTTALIRTGQGRLRLVTFEEGWAIYTTERPGTLVAVCLAETPTPRRR